jgi:hypothetical protein
MNIDMIIDIGDEVTCDFCNADYTDSDAVGGILIGSYAICPRCVTKRSYAEADLRAGKDEKFKDFVLRIRTHNTIGVASM